MNKIVIIGIVGSGIIIGVFAVLSLDSFSIIVDNDELSESTLGKEEGVSGLESKPQGRDLSIELDEKMGFSAP